MIVHNSKHENEGWINVEKTPPETRKKVKLACVRIVDWNIEDLVYESIGWMVLPGVFSVKSSKTATKEAVFKNKPTHWKEI